MLFQTLDNLHFKNDKEKTFVTLTTPGGEKVNIYFIDSKHKFSQVRIGIDCKRDIQIDRNKTNKEGKYERLGTS